MREINKTEERDIAMDEVLSEISMEKLPPEMRDDCNHADWKSLTPVQAKSIPYFLTGHDMMMPSRTDSGKIGAYILPIIQKMNEQQNIAQALELVPSRKLTLKVSRKAQMLTQEENIRTAVVYEGV